ncbi:hypothetical protein [Streptomyces sp. NPDC002640]
MKTAVPAGISAIGLALMVLMITTEGEPGALPLFLVVLGAVWFAVVRLRRAG